MNKRLMVVLGSAVLVFTAALAGAWILTLPATPELTAAPSISRQEAEATLAALKPPKRERPLVAILGINEATEVTDYLMPYGILKRSGVADVLALATHAGPVRLYPALRAEPDATTSQFDSQYPDGADYVVVPAMDPGDDPAALEWLRSQADKGAKIISVCAGAKVLGQAGLLDNRRATTHWFFVKELQERTPSLQYVPDRRLVVDDGVATTTGITASMPMMLTLIEAIAGREKAEAVARDLGVTQWDAGHTSSAFQLTRPFATTVLGNILAFWRYEELAIKLEKGVDEVSLALVADTWSRTYRSSVQTYAASNAAVESHNGLRIVPDVVRSSGQPEQLAPTATDARPAQALDTALRDIEGRYGSATAGVVAMQLEYPDFR